MASGENGDRGQMAIQVGGKMDLRNIGEVLAKYGKGSLGVGVFGD